MTDPERIKVFKEEAQELLAKLREGLSHWHEQRGGAHNPQAAQELFRCAHTLKGLAGAVQQQALAELSKALTEILRAVKDGRATLTNGQRPLLLRSVNACQALIEQQRIAEYETLLNALQEAGQGPTQH